MTKQLEAAYQKERYDKGYARSIEDRWPINSRDLESWKAWIKDPLAKSSYVEGRIAGAKALRLQKLLNK